MNFNEGPTNIILMFGIFLVVVILGKLLTDYTNRKNLVYGKKKAKSTLLNFAKVSNYRLFCNKTINYNGVKTHFDYLVVGSFGLLAVNVLEPKGEYCGEENQDKWVFSNQNTRDYIENPIKQNQDALAELKKMIGKELNIYKFNLETITVFGGRENKTQVYTKSEDKICYAKNLNRLLKNEKFLLNKNVDVNKMINLIEKY